MEFDPNTSSYFVHRLLHPFYQFPACWWKKKIPRSELIKIIEKENKLWILMWLTITLSIPSIIFCMLVRWDAINAYGLVQVDAIRYCEHDCAPRVFQVSDQFSVPIRNVTIRMEHYYFGNVSSDDFCLSHSMESARECFQKSFPNQKRGVLNLLEEENSLLHERLASKDIVYNIDNTIHKFKFVNPSIESEIDSTANYVTVISLLVIIAIYVFAILISLFKLEGENVFQKLMGYFSFSTEECKNVNLNYIKIVAFNQRIIYQESNAPFKHLMDPQSKCLFNRDENSVITPNEYECKKQLEMISSILKEDEEILSYESLSPDFTSKSESNQIWTRSLNAFFITIISMFIAHGIFMIGLFVFNLLSPSVFMLITVTLALDYFILRKSITKVHCILTNYQIITLEESTNYRTMYSIDLENISNMWTRSVPSNFGFPDRQELLVELGSGGEEHNRGVMAIHVTDPQYYIDFISKRHKDEN